jgi:hypothetical protein
MNTIIKIALSNNNLMIQQERNYKVFKDKVNKAN